MTHIIPVSVPLNINPFSNHNSFLFWHINCQVIIIYLRKGLMHIHDGYYQSHLNLKSLLNTDETRCAGL